MRITMQEQLAGFQELIGGQNFIACQKAFADGCKLWVFRTIEEIEGESDLTRKEKDDNIARFNQYGWAGHCRIPPRQPVVGFESAVGFDTHGNRY